MACMFESSDNSLVVRPSDPPWKWDSNSLVREVDRIQAMYPQLAHQDLASSQKLLEEKKLLPGFELIASRDVDGRVRDENGRVVMLSESELKKAFSKGDRARTMAFDKSKLDATVAFDSYSSVEAKADPQAGPHVGSHVGSLADSNNSANIPRMSRAWTTQALTLGILTDEERAGLTFIKDNFDNLAAIDPYFSNDSISKTAIEKLKQPIWNNSQRPLSEYSTENPEFASFDSNDGYERPVPPPLTLTFDPLLYRDEDGNMRPRHEAVEAPAPVDTSDKQIYSLLRGEDREYCDYGQSPW